VGEREEDSAAGHARAGRRVGHRDDDVTVHNPAPPAPALLPLGPFLYSRSDVSSSQTRTPYPSSLLLLPPPLAAAGVPLPPPSEVRFRFRFPTSPIPASFLDLGLGGPHQPPPGCCCKDRVLVARLRVGLGARMVLFFSFSFFLLGGTSLVLFMELDGLEFRTRTRLECR
jgi:hypothetical protein